MMQSTNTNPSSSTDPAASTPRPNANVALLDILKRDAIASRTEMHSWEQQLVKTWEEVAEDEQGRLRIDGDLGSALSRKKALEAEYLRTRGDRDAIVQKGLIRNLAIIVDLSLASAVKEDKKFTRKQLLFDALDIFIDDFFAQNPVSQLCLIVSDTKSERITTLSGSPLEQKRRLRTFDSRNAGFSLQNALTVAISTLAHVKTHGSREVLVAMSSLSTTDPGDIESTILLLQKERIRVSFLMLSAEVYITKHIAQQTQGTYIVARNIPHIHEALLSFVAPPLVTDEQQEEMKDGKDSKASKDGTPQSQTTTTTTTTATSANVERRFERRWVRVGFPNREVFHSHALNNSNNPHGSMSQNTQNQFPSMGMAGGNLNTGFLDDLTRTSSLHNPLQIQSGMSSNAIASTTAETFCSCHFHSIKEGYRCPRCNALVCELPTTCCSCEITLVASPQLAKSYHHSFPVPSYVIIEVPSIATITTSTITAGTTGTIGTIESKKIQINANESFKNNFQFQPIISTSSTSTTSTTSTTRNEGSLQNSPQNQEIQPLQFTCFGCKVRINTKSEIVLLCPDCELPFCIDCDEYVHLALHNCPGCLSSSQTIHTNRKIINSSKLTFKENKGSMSMTAPSTHTQAQVQTHQAHPSHTHEETAKKIKLSTNTTNIIKDEKPITKFNVVNPSTATTITATAPLPPSTQIKLEQPQIQTQTQTRQPTVTNFKLPLHVQQPQTSSTSTNINLNMNMNPHANVNPTSTRIKLEPMPVNTSTTIKLEMGSKATTMTPATTTTATTSAPRTLFKLNIAPTSSQTISQTTLSSATTASNPEESTTTTTTPKE